MTVTINQAAGQADPTTNGPIRYTAVFSTAVRGFAASDVTTGGTAGGSKTVLVTDSGNHSTFDVVVSGMTSSGTVSAIVVGGAASDRKGNLSLSSTFTDNTVTYSSSVATSSAAGTTTTTTSTTTQSQESLLVGLTGDLSGWAGDSWNLASELGVKVVREEIYGRAHVSETLDWASQRAVKVIGLTYHELGSSEIDAWPQIQTWEIDNEPYWEDVNPTTWGQAWCQDVVSIKAAHPTLKILLPMATYQPGGGANPGDYTYGGVTRPWDVWISEACPNIYELADGFAVHPYGSLPSADLALVDYVHNQLALRGATQPFYVTEIGWHTASTQNSNYASEATQAADITAFIDGARTRSWIKAVCVYRSLSSRMRHFGVRI